MKKTIFAKKYHCKDWFYYESCENTLRINYNEIFNEDFYFSGTFRRLKELEPKLSRKLYDILRYKKLLDTRVQELLNSEVLVEDDFELDTSYKEVGEFGRDSDDYEE